MFKRAINFYSKKIIDEKDTTDQDTARRPWTIVQARRNYHGHARLRGVWSYLNVKRHLSLSLKTSLSFVNSRRCRSQRPRWIPSNYRYYPMITGAAKVPRLRFINDGHFAAGISELSASWNRAEPEFFCSVPRHVSPWRCDGRAISETADIIVRRDCPI